jgi:hypothetical protein
VPVTGVIVFLLAAVQIDCAWELEGLTIADEYEYLSQHAVSPLQKLPSKFSVTCAKQPADKSRKITEVKMYCLGKELVLIKSLDILQIKGIDWFSKG